LRCHRSPHGDYTQIPDNASLAPPALLRYDLNEDSWRRIEGLPDDLGGSLAATSNALIVYRGLDEYEPGRDLVYSPLDDVRDIFAGIG
jgi:hypothetical protein